MTPDDYLLMITDKAKDICGKYALPYACCVAQGALESSWGNDGIGNGGYNLFGRKWGGTGDYVELQTQEDDGNGSLYTIMAKFQSYQDIGDAINDWCQLMIWGDYKYYATQYQCDKELGEEGALEAFVRGIAGIYATDVNYAAKILQTIRACGLETS